MRVSNEVLILMYILQESINLIAKLLTNKVYYYLLILVEGFAKGGFAIGLKAFPQHHLPKIKKNYTSNNFIFQMFLPH